MLRSIWEAVKRRLNFQLTLAVPTCASILTRPALQLPVRESTPFNRRRCLFAAAPLLPRRPGPLVSPPLLPPGFLAQGPRAASHHSMGRGGRSPGAGLSKYVEPGGVFGTRDVLDHRIDLLPHRRLSVPSIGPG